MPPEPAPLITERLTLEPTTHEHAPALWEAIEPSLPELKRWMTWASTSSQKDVTGYAERMEEGWRNWTNWDFVTTFEGRVVGTIGLNRYDELWRSCNLGYWIRTDASGKGIATEAGRAVLDFGFTEIGLNRVELVAATDNLRSQRVAEKLGFRREGTKREGTILDGRGVDSYLYGLLSSDPRD